METTPVHSLSFSGVLSESKRIVRANYGHFVALSLFFLPLALSVLTTPSLRLSGQLFTADHLHKLPPISHLLYIITLYIISFCALGTITYSTYHAFQGTPIDFFTSLKSLISSFFPLISTSIVIHLLLFCISLSFLLFVWSIITIAQNLGFVIVTDYNSAQFIWISVIIGVILIVILLYFQVNWSLAFVIAVTESNWGFRALMRSSYLVKGMRSVSFSLMLYYGVFGALMVLLFINNVVVNGFSGWPIMLLMILDAYFLMMCMLMNTTGNTVLYMYCKALHGELAIEIDDQFAYINLPSDEEKAPLVVTVAEV